MKKRLFSKWFIVPFLLITMISTLIVGRTWAYFNDLETSTGNTSTGWTSTQWTQTDKTHFDAGVLTNVNTSLSSGNVILGAGSGSGANMILFWDGGSPPTNWTDVSASGQAFYQRFPRGEAAYGSPSGSATHTHTATFASPTSGGSGSVSIGTGTSAGALATHTHTLNSSTISTDSNLPIYRNLQVITYIGIPTTIPAGAIAVFDTGTLPSGWTQYSSENGYFVRGEATASGTGGNATHIHTMTITTNTTANTSTIKTAASTAYATSTHTHTQATSTNPTVSNDPPYITAVLAKATADTAIPCGMIAMFDASPSGNWSVLSGIGGDFYQKFLLGGSSYGTPGGLVSHNHANQTITTTTVTGTATDGKNTGTADATSTHTHTVGVTAFSTASNLPPYINVIFAKALYNASGTIASQVLFIDVPGSGWDGLAWDRTLPAGTGITFEVRASDTYFAPNAPDGSPSWTSVGGTSPVISSLPAGRYKQWRATLTPDGPKTSTPILEEVRLFYYGG